LSLEDTFCNEKIHNKFCKYILGLKKIACNISAKSELGRFPTTDYIKTQAILYFCRLQTDPINSLLKEACSLCKSVDSDGIYTWHSFIGNIIKELDLEITEFENFTRPFASIKHSLKEKIKKVINDSYSKKTLEKLSSFNETSKLYIYSKIKSELKLENYLLFFSNFKMRRLLTKFRVSDHSLEIESVRYKKYNKGRKYM
jgi:hypothetical protein